MPGTAKAMMMNDDDNDWLAVHCSYWKHCDGHRPNWSHTDTHRKFSMEGKASSLFSDYFQSNSNHFTTSTLQFSHSRMAATRLFGSFSDEL